MASLLDTLIGEPPQRDDETRLSIKRRAPPTRSRDLFDAFATMGVNASFDGLLRAFEMKSAKPHLLTYAALGRWPTEAETAALPDPFKRQQHLKRLLLSDEFRLSFLRRVLDAFPEKHRVLFVRLPRCAGAHAMATLRKGHPVLPLDLANAKYRNIDALTIELGEITRLFSLTRTLVVEMPRMAPFITAPPYATSDPDPLRWLSLEPPCRGTDSMFAILRPPQDLALSEVNGALTSLRQGGTPKLPDGVSTPRPRADLSEWRDFGRRLLPHIVSTNPVCTALGDGTARGALAACACVPIQLVSLSRYPEWARGALGGESEEQLNKSVMIVRPEDLDADDLACLQARTGEDMAFYARFHARFTADGLPAVPGTNL